MLRFETFYFSKQLHHVLRLSLNGFVAKITQTSVSASPFLFNATVTHHLLRYHSSHPALIDTLLQSIYVDDVTCGADSEEEAYQLYVQSKKIFAKGGFNLHKFITNSATLQSRIEASDQAAGIQSCNTVVERTPHTPVGSSLVIVH